MTDETTLSSLHFFATAAMTGVIWVVQLVQYPGMLLIPPDAFRQYHERHCRMISFVVGPLMLLELGSIVFLALLPARSAVTFALLGLTVICWCSTAFVQVPIHKRLEQGYSEELLRQLVRFNWLRTAAWSVKVGLLLSA